MDIFIIPITDVPAKEKFIVFRPLAGLAFIGNQAMVDIALSYKDAFPKTIEADVDKFLESIGFFNPDPPSPQPIQEEFLPSTVVPLLTNQCQLHCTYCYAAAGENPRFELQIEHGRTSIDYVCDNAERLNYPHFEVSFHGGGEPTFAWDILKELTEYSRQKKIPAKITLTTNGVWSPSQYDWIITNVDEFTISMDGSPETQDRQRPLSSGSGSSDIVMRTINNLDQRSFPYGIRMTAIDPWSNLPNDVRYLCEHTKCQVIQVEPAFNIKRGGHCQPNEMEASAFADAYLEAFDIAAQAKRNFFYSGARLGMVTANFCTAPYQALIVTPGGNLVTCYETTSKSHPLGPISVIGEINNEEVCVDNLARDNLHNLMVERRSTCRECFSYWSCAGDCYTRAFDVGTAGHLAHSTRCDMNRLIIEKLLLWNIEQSGGVWRMPRIQHTHRKKVSY